MPDNNTRGPRDTPPVAPIYRIGDEITFKYEGNIRATVVGSEVIGGALWLTVNCNLTFQVPAGRVVCFEPKGGGHE